jgi:polysaccharide biosynthesis protein PelG
VAGVGFVLRKLTARGDLLGVAQGYLHASISTSGGWLFTILTLSAISTFGPRFASYEDLSNFRLIVVYNFAFSLVFTGPLTMVLTRYLSDRIFARTVDGIPGMVVGGLATALVLALPVAGPFYFWYTELSTAARLAAWVGYVLVSGIWVLGVFLSTLKEYAAVTRAFAVGMLVALTAAYNVGPDAGVGGMLIGFDVGLACVLFALVGRVFAEFPFPIKEPFAFMPYFRLHWALALGGGVYYAGVWVDKWLMWTAPERVTLTSGLVMNPDYDSALFLASLTLVPSMAVFVVNVETRFFDRYHKFYGQIASHATLHRIRENQLALVRAVFLGSRQLVVPQVGLVLTLLALAPAIFSAFDIPYGQIGIFRITALGALFQLLFLLLTIVLSYLDLHRLTLALHSLFFAVNALGTLATLWLGFPTYGYGYFLASVVAFLTACVVTLRCLEDLPYHAFITGNASVRTAPNPSTEA